MYAPFVALLLATATRADTATYTVTFDAHRIRHIHVVAQLPLLNDTLRMSAIMTAPLADGYATFVHDLRASDGSRRIPLRLLPGGKWIVDGRRPERISLEYDVVIGHDSVDWSVSGAWARGYTTDNTVYFTGRSVFIAAGGADSMPSRVRFRLPPKWRVATTCRPVNADSTEFESDGLADLWANGNLAGTLAIEVLTAGKLRVEFAGAESMRSGIRLFGGTFRPILETYRSIMHGAPTGSLLIISNVDPDKRFDAGEAFRQSISTWSAEMPTAATRNQWAYLMAHEIFHLWNSKELPPIDQTPFEWFVEGFTEYMSRLAMWRAGLSTEQEFRSELASARAKYLSVAGRISLRAAGENKGGNFTLVYSGGETLAATLDSEMRAQTHGATGVPELLARLYQDYQRTLKPYDYARLIAVTSELAKRDMSGFFARYVAGTEIIPPPRR